MCKLRITLLTKKLIALGVILLFSPTPFIAQGTQQDVDRLNIQVLQLYQEGRLEEAIPIAERVVTMRTRLLDDNDGDATANVENLSASLVNLANLYRSTGRFENAEPLLLKAQELKRKLSATDLNYSRLLNNLALLYADTGRYEKAEPIYLEAVEIRRKTIGPDNPDNASLLNNLARLYKDTGRYNKAEELYLRALELRKRVNREDFDYATALNNLASLYASTGRADRAETLYLQATDIIKLRLGTDNPYYAQSLNNLGLLYKDLGRFEKAEELYLQAIAIQAKPNSRDAAYGISLNNLGDLYKTLGRYDDAEGLYSLAAETYEKSIGLDHPYNVGLLENLSLVEQARGRNKEAVAYLTRAMESEQGNISRIFAVSSESTMQAYLSTVRSSLDGLISMAASNPSDPNIELTLTWVLRRKAMILDTLIRFHQAQLLAKNDPTVAEEAGRLRYLRQQMSNLPLNHPRGLSDEQLQGQIARWREESDQIESNLNRKLSTEQNYPSVEKVNLNLLRQKLPSDGVLIEYVRSNIYDFKATRQQARWKAAHYFAFVMTPEPGASPRMIDLGEATHIDQAIRNVRANIAQFEGDWKVGKIDSLTARRPNAIKSEKEAEQAYVQESKKLYDLVFAPVRKELARSVRMIYVSPDDQLNLLPFEALVDESGKYLIESYRFAYLSSGRDLLREPAKSNAQGSVVFADPDYDMIGSARATKAKQLLSNLSQSGVSGGPQAVGGESAPAVRTFKSVGQGDSKQVRGALRWDPLPDSADEAKAVERELAATEFAPIRAFLKSDALEDVFKNIHSPLVLHVSTHGFFPEATGDDRAYQAPLDIGSGNAAVLGLNLLRQTGNPLLRSGLVLSGANTIGAERSATQTAEADDGWVTSEEIALMKLDGTKLVVLSSCGSGLGAVSTGEGVYGLRRAFQNAGARTIISTLFDVPDKESERIVQSFYQTLKKQKGKLESLHAAQMQMIRERRRVEQAAHPFFWASFVLMGDPN